MDGVLILSLQAQKPSHQAISYASYTALQLAGRSFEPSMSLQHRTVHNGTFMVTRKEIWRMKGVLQ